MLLARRQLIASTAALALPGCKADFDRILAGNAAFNAGFRCA